MSGDAQPTCLLSNLEKKVIFSNFFSILTTDNLVAQNELCGPGRMEAPLHGAVSFKDLVCAKFSCGASISPHLTIHTTLLLFPPFIELLSHYLSNDSSTSSLFGFPFDLPHLDMDPLKEDRRKANTKKSRRIAGWT